MVNSKIDVYLNESNLLFIIYLKIVCIYLNTGPIKIKNQKLDLGVDIDDYIAAIKRSDVIQIIPIDENIWLESVKLQWEHRDPADRVVVAIAQKNQAPIITADQKIANFYSSVIW
jgi:PIN domain nuclease of toxin-antitoxin system